MIMAVLNHHIVAVHDPEATARFFMCILGLPPAVKLGEFVVLRVSGDTTLDFIGTGSDDFDRQHYAFLVTETEFDEIFDRIKSAEIAYWSDPMHHDAGQVNAWDDGRGVYFDDPDGHRLEIITRPYGSGGTEAEHPHPLVAPTVEGSPFPANIH
jgi:catechol 2,3-dioxygenase-like lactoylglutathione lyase family enzyme